MKEARDIFEDYKAQNAVYISDVQKLRDWLQVGDIVKAEVFHIATLDRTFQHEAYGTEAVEIKEKYKHFAITDKGTVTWNDIAIHNKDLVRRCRNESKRALF